ncbi:glutamate racemase [Cerasibacillus quisquiliarum]|uniref:Glutamate racemase n=1 Tax=Cerasibacillus quisquiliarum TaxID=227865 RepID=A0A511UXU6_9BACI|nr:glutamate racemase [Cerasibacillus quisquiliarum]MBB5145660.1 glutamate racemase [Cerasibacillus quisquiliarum]GEN31454.1 glutamate racemase 1 [Cerasibacillus quisquiliarum]
MERPIGVIDSGVGGLTVAQELMRQLPNEQLIYFGDTLRCPYGSRTKDEIIQFTWEMVHFLFEKNIKMLVIACNTATAYTLKSLQQQLPIPVIGVIKPGARAAIKATKNNVVGVIGTEATVSSKAYETALKQIKPEITVQSLACPLFVPMVEKGILSGEEAERVVKHSLKSLIKDNRMDTLVLGCTHYPLLKETIQSVIGDDLTIISSSDETARETSAILEVHNLLATKPRQNDHIFYTTGELEIFRHIAKVIFNNTPKHIKKVKL